MARPTKRLPLHAGFFGFAQAIEDGIEHGVSGLLAQAQKLVLPLGAGHRSRAHLWAGSPWLTTVRTFTPPLDPARGRRRRSPRHRGTSTISSSVPLARPPRAGTPGYARLDPAQPAVGVEPQGVGQHDPGINASPLQCRSACARSRGRWMPPPRLGKTRPGAQPGPGRLRSNSENPERSSASLSAADQARRGAAEQQRRFAVHAHQLQKAGEMRDVVRRKEHDRATHFRVQFGAQGAGRLHDDLLGEFSQHQARGGSVFHDEW